MLSEVKLIWRWEKKKIPTGLEQILVEKNDRQLRRRKFERGQRWKLDSISNRVATRAVTEISEIEKINTKSTLKNHYKKRIINTYRTDCRIRNCFICTTN